MIKFDGKKSSNFYHPDFNMKKTNISHGSKNLIFDDVFVGKIYIISTSHSMMTLKYLTNIFKDIKLNIPISTLLFSMSKWWISVIHRDCRHHR